MYHGCEVSSDDTTCDLASDMWSRILSSQSNVYPPHAKSSAAPRPRFIAAQPERWRTRHSRQKRQEQGGSDQEERGGVV